MIFNLRITYRCNRRCSYCNIANFYGDGDLETILDYLDFLLKHDVEVGLYGGEALMYPHIDQILNKYPNVLNIITNGDFLEDERIELFKKIVISVHDDFDNSYFEKLAKYPKIEKYLIVYTNETYTHIMNMYNQLKPSFQKKIRLIPYKNKKKNNLFLDDEAKSKIKILNPAEYEKYNIDEEECLKNKQISNIDFVKNTITYCCVSHYREPLSKELVLAAINNQYKEFDFETQLLDCKMCTKKW